MILGTVAVFLGICGLGLRDLGMYRELELRFELAICQAIGLGFGAWCLEFL